MLKRMYAGIRFDREIDAEKHYIIPGGYEMTFAGKAVQFDFEDYSGTIDKVDKTVLHTEQENLDISAFPEAASITPEDIKNLEKINEFFVYTGEDGDPEINPVELEFLSFEFVENGTVTYIICKGEKAEMVIRELSESWKQKENTVRPQEEKYE